MKIHIRYASQETQNAVLNADQETLFAAFSSINDQLGAGRTSGKFFDGLGQELGVWALELTAEDFVEVSSHDPSFSSSE